MNEQNPKQNLKALYLALKERPLDPGVDVGLYEPFVEKLPEGDPIARLFTGISFSDDNESLHLVTGQRGTGKTTELLRLRNLLQDNGYVVFYINMLDYLHGAESVEISDFLIASCIGLAKDAQEKYGVDQWQATYWQRLKAFLGSVQLEKASLAAEGFGVKFGVDLAKDLRVDADFKRTLQAKSRGHLRELIDDAHQFVMDTVVAVRNKLSDPHCQVALIIDSFEQIRGYYSNATDVHKSIVSMFTTYGHSLRLPMLHTVMTVPPYLSIAAPNVARNLGSSALISLPSIHVRRYRQSEPDSEGLRTMREILYRRTASVRQIFNDKGLDELAIASGGDLRDFFMLVRESLVLAGLPILVELPIQLPVLRRACEQLQRNMPIDDQAVQWLYKVHMTGQVELLNGDKLPELGQLFDANLIINYRNGDDWYGIHPLVVDYVQERQKVLDGRETDN